MASILLSYSINMDTFDVSGCFPIFFFKKRTYSQLKDTQSGSLLIFLWQVQHFLVFEKLLMQTATGTSFLIHGWKNLCLTSFGILFHLQLNLTSVMVIFFFLITWLFLKMTLSGGPVENL